MGSHDFPTADVISFTVETTNLTWTPALTVATKRSTPNHHAYVDQPGHDRAKRSANKRQRQARKSARR